MTSNHGTPCTQLPREYTWQTLIEFSLSNQPGSERLAVERVAQAIQGLNWSAAQLEQLRLALAQAARKAAECSCRYASDEALLIRVLIPEDDPATGEADQAGGRPASRGWGFFLIEKAAPDSNSAGRHLLELFLYPGGK